MTTACHNESLIRGRDQEIKKEQQRREARASSNLEANL